MGARSLRYEVGVPRADLGIIRPPGAALGGRADPSPEAGRAAAGDDRVPLEGGALDCRSPGCEAPDGSPGAGCGGATSAAAAGRRSCCTAALSGAAVADCAPAPRSVTTRSPVLTLPPLLVCSFSTTPAAVEGTSIVALSDSSVSSGVSTSMVSPGSTSTSMTATSLKLPMSGTRTSRLAAAFIARPRRSDFPRHRLIRIDAERLDGAPDGRPVHAMVVGECLQGSYHDVIAVDLEKPAQRRSRVGAPESIRTERHVAPAYPLTDLVRNGAHVVGRRDDRPFASMQHLPHVGHAPFLTWVQEIPALALERLAPQLAEARDRQHVGRDAVVVLEDLRRRQALAQDGARAEECRANLAAAANLQQVATGDDAGLHARGHGRLRVILVHQGDVIKDAFLLREHAAQAFMDDHRQLVRVRRIVGDAVRHRGRHQLAVTILMLQALAGEGGAAGGRAEKESTRLTVARSPDEVADALKAEHRIEDVEGHHVDAVVAVGGARSDP